MAQHRSLTHVRTTAITNSRQIRAIFPKMALYFSDLLTNKVRKLENERRRYRIFFVTSKIPDLVGISIIVSSVPQGSLLLLIPHFSIWHYHSALKRGKHFGGLQKSVLRVVFSEIGIRTWGQAVSCQKQGLLWLASLPIYQLEAWFFTRNSLNSCLIFGDF